MAETSMTDAVARKCLYEMLPILEMARGRAETLYLQDENVVRHAMRRLGPCECEAATWYPDEWDDDGKPICCIVVRVDLYSQEEVEVWRVPGELCPACGGELVQPEEEA